MTKVKDIIEAIEEKFPRSLAMEWDNPGLIIGRFDREVRRIQVSLDATEDAVTAAVEHKADLIVTHHPMLFSAVKQINEETAEGRKLLRLAENKIACYAMHTNFDIGRGGMADLVAEGFGLSACTSLEPLEETGADKETGLPYGVGFTGILPEVLTAKALAAFVKERFKLPAVRYYDAGRPIRRIAVCPGSGKGMLRFALQKGADALITGDMGHHDGLDAVEAGISLIDAGHYGLEKVYIPYMEQLLKEAFPDAEVYSYTKEPYGVLV